MLDSSEDAGTTPLHPEHVHCADHAPPVRFNSRLSGVHLSKVTLSKPVLAGTHCACTL